MELLEARKKLGLNQTELAKELKVSRTTICDWETKKTMPTIRSTKKIKDFFQKHGIEIEIKI